MESFWKADEVAAAVKVSVQTVYRYVARGEIPFHKLNRAVRFKPSEIEKWLESRKSSPAARNGNLEGELFPETKTAETTGEENFGSAV